MRRHAPAFSAVMFLAFAAMFSVVFWPDVSMAAKIAFFAAGVGCGVSIMRLVKHGS